MTGRPNKPGGGRPKLKPGDRDPRRGKGHITQASLSFREKLADGGLRPSALLLGRMRNDPAYFADGEKIVPMRERVEIADKLVQYELPRLAAIEAEVDHVGMSHEDWVRTLSDDLIDEAHTEH